MKPLITLEEYNKRGDDFKKGILVSDPIKNGIACPDCGDELFDTNPGTILLSSPPQKNIHCASCDYKGYRYV